MKKPSNVEDLSTFRQFVKIQPPKAEKKKDEPKPKPPPKK